ncbi:hypothetical protein BDB00DRAFT_880466 [Zychaea mexicana]|uniref:uncharacterized protein n=1 Tax=Zychaea mexicana TaxID=64656 RepID=UPI0022FEC2A1|nr:uncharacterized protein BDB00DRAFT_880466 [Zychaea mexicana]KAI9467795.1 hypothetical protein BDB00DRAFT_880466 [Zychaea mexicana]
MADPIPNHYRDLQQRSSCSTDAARSIGGRCMPFGSVDQISNNDRRVLQTLLVRLVVVVCHLDQWIVRSSSFLVDAAISFASGV